MVCISGQGGRKGDPQPVDTNHHNIGFLRRSRLAAKGREIYVFGQDWDI
jgi:hypothetical protein